jgi:hypothetical protein
MALTGKNWRFHERKTPKTEDNKMEMKVRVWTHLLFVIFLAGCATRDLDVSTSPTPDFTAATATSTASEQVTVPLVPGSPNDPPQVPLPVIILTPVPQGSTPNPEAVVTPASAHQREKITQAAEDLARRLNITADQIQLIDIASVVWSDGSLGCPQPGMFYTQALVEGLRIRLGVGERIYHYHSGRNQAPFLCENPSEDTGIPGFEVNE